MYPFSVGGKTIACLLMILGLLFMSLPIDIIGSNVIVQYDRMHKKAKESKQMKNSEHVERRVSGMGIEQLHKHPHSPLENVNSQAKWMSSNVQQTSNISGISADLDSADSELRAILRDFTALQQRLKVLCSKKQ